MKIQITLTEFLFDMVTGLWISKKYPLTYCKIARMHSIPKGLLLCPDGRVTEIPRGKTSWKGPREISFHKLTFSRHAKTGWVHVNSTEENCNNTLRKLRNTSPISNVKPYNLRTTYTCHVHVIFSASPSKRVWVLRLGWLSQRSSYKSERAITKNTC